MQASNLTMPEFMRFHAQDMMEDEDYEFDYEDSDQVLALNYPDEECLRKPFNCACVRAHRDWIAVSLAHSRSRTHSLTHARARTHHPHNDLLSPPCAGPR